MQGGLAITGYEIDVGAALRDKRRDDVDRVVLSVRLGVGGRGWLSGVAGSHRARDDGVRHEPLGRARGGASCAVARACLEKFLRD